MDTKFRADPYNFNNKLIESSDIINIMKKLNINDFNITDITLYQKAMIHKSYCELPEYKNLNTLVKIVYHYKKKHMKL